VNFYNMGGNGESRIWGVGGRLNVIFPGFGKSKMPPLRRAAGQHLYLKKGGVNPPFS
jgi:hypothetical protein